MGLKTPLGELFRLSLQELHLTSLKIRLAKCKSLSVVPAGTLPCLHHGPGTGTWLLAGSHPATRNACGAPGSQRASGMPGYCHSPLTRLRAHLPRTSIMSIP